MTRETCRGDQRPNDPPATIDVELTHPTEVDLQFIARLTIGDRHRRALRAVPAALVADVALHRSQRHPHTMRVSSSWIFTGQPVVDPVGHGVVVVLQPSPRLTVTPAATAA